MEQAKLSGATAPPSPTVFAALTDQMKADEVSASHRVRAYGLDIWSDIELPEFMPPGGGVDAVVLLENEDPSVECAQPGWTFSEEEVVCSFPKVARFQIRAGREIRVTPVPGADTALIRLYVEGMMMAILLHQRGYYVLHASVVQMGDRAVAFLGHIGAGKSTMALALQGQGHQLIADDNAAIDLSGAESLVTPAFPRVKIYPAVAAALGITDEALSPLHATQVKKTRFVEGRFPVSPVPLDRIYVLSRDADPGIQQLSAGESFIELIRNSVPTRWGLAGGPARMKTSAALARRVPVYQVRTFRQLDEIMPLIRNLEAHALQTPSGDGRANIRLKGAVSHGA